MGAPRSPELSLVETGNHSDEGRTARRRWLRPRVFVSLALLLFALDAAFVVVSTRSSLLAARTDLQQAERDFRDGRFASARALLDAARSSADRVRGARWHPAALVAGVLPLVEDDAAALSRLADAAALSSQAGLEAIGAVESARRGSERLSEAVFSNGAIDFDAIRRAGPHLAEAHGLLKQASDELRRAPDSHLGAVDDAVAEGRERLDSATESAGRADVLLSSLPDFLGRTSTRRYFLAFQSPSEERATGGLLGFYGVLQIARGRVSLTGVGPIARLEAALPEPADAPAWFVHEYESFGGLVQWRQASFSPDFPTVARVWLSMYEKSVGADLDGVIAMDPAALARMMTATGPIQAGGRLLTGENVERFLLHDSYELSQREQRPIIRDVITEFWGALGSGDVDAPALIGGLSDAASTGHLKLYSANSDTERAFARLHVDGSLDAFGSNVQLVYQNDLGANKVDYFEQRDINTRVAIDSSGSLKVSTTVRIQNNAPAGPPSILLGGAGANARPGENQMAFNILMPRGATFRRFYEKGRRYFPLRGADDGRPRVWDVLFIGSGKSYEVGVRYTVPNAVDLEADEPELSLALLPQPMVNPDRLELRIEPPPGYSLAAHAPGLTPDGDALESTGAFDRPLVLDVVLSTDA